MKEDLTTDQKEFLLFIRHVPNFERYYNENNKEFSQVTITDLKNLLPKCLKIQVRQDIWETYSLKIFTKDGNWFVQYFNRDNQPYFFIKNKN